jgi:hypothetical protein
MLPLFSEGKHQPLSASHNAGRNDAPRSRLFTLTPLWRVDLRTNNGYGQRLCATMKNMRLLLLAMN